MKSALQHQTMRELVTQRMREKGLKRSQLIQSMGYANSAKGLKRLDLYLDTLRAPSEQFVDNLLQALDITGVQFMNASNASVRQMRLAADKESRQRFTPHIQILHTCAPGPWFVRCFLKQRCLCTIPTHLQSLPFSQEIDQVQRLYRDHCETLGFAAWVRGFQYYRQHDYYLQFHHDGTLEEIAQVSLPGTRSTRTDKVCKLLTASSHPTENS